MRDIREGVNIGIIKVRFLFGVKVELKYSFWFFQGYSCFGLEKLLVCVTDNFFMFVCQEKDNILLCYVLIDIIISFVQILYMRKY